MKKKMVISSVLSILLIFSFIFGELFVSPIRAQETAICVAPSSLTEQVGQTFEVAINVTDVYNLWAWQFSLSFDPGLLEVLNVIEGPFLRNSGPTAWSPPTIDNVGGSVTASDTRIPPPPTGSNGEGILAFIEFHCKGPGSSSLHLFNTWLWQPGMVPISHVTLDGLVTQVSPPPEVLPLDSVESLNFSANGAANGQISMNVPASLLTKLYRRTLGAPSNAPVEEIIPIPLTMEEPESISYGENVTATDLNVTQMEIPVREEFYNSTVQELESLLGFPTTISSSCMMPNGTSHELRVYLNASSELQVVNVTVVYPGQQKWVVQVGPIDDNATAVSASDAMSKVAIAQEMLGYLDQTQEGNLVFDHLWRVNMTLPVDATLLNGAAIDGLNWSIGFGGGTYMNASVSLGGPNQIALTERTYVTEQNVTASPDDLLQGFSTYGKFNIEYLLPPPPVIGGPGGAHVLLMSASKPIIPGSAAPGNDNDWSWTWSRTVSPGSFTASLTYSYISATLKVTPSLTVSGYVGWDFKWSWSSWSYYLSWFKTYMSVTPSVTANVTVGVTASKSKTWSQTLYTWSTTYDFQIGPVPVVLTFEFDVTFNFAVNANGQLTWSIAETVSSTFTAGVQWQHGSGWSTIQSQTSSASKTGPRVSCGASASVSPSLEFKLSALFYDVAGPFISFTPSATITITYTSSNHGTWSASLNFEIDAGVTYSSWLKGILGLNDYSHTLYNWTLASWSGSW